MKPRSIKVEADTDFTKVTSKIRLRGKWLA